MMDSNSQPRLSNEPKRGHPRKISIGILAESFSHPRTKDPAQETSKVKQSDHQTSPWLRSNLPVSVPTPTEGMHTTTTAPAAKNAAAVSSQKISFATLTSMPEDQMTKPEPNGSDTLRLKLWEILGTIASPNQQHDHNVEPLSQDNDEEPVPTVKPRQNSDSIESDSEALDPDFVVRRPVTRTLIRKKTAGRLKANKMETQQSPHPSKATRGVTNKSFLKEGNSKRQHCAVRGSSLTFTRKRCQRRSPGNIATTMGTTRQVNPGEDQPLKSQGNRRPSHEKPRVQGKASEVDDELHQSRDGEFTVPERVAPEVDPRQVHIKDENEHVRNTIYSPKNQKDLDQADQNLDDDDLPTFGVEVPKESYFPESPAIKKRRPLEESSPSSQHREESRGADDGSPAKELSNKGIQTFRSFLSSTSNYFKSDSELNFSGYADKLESSPCRKPKPVVEEEPECRLSLSSPEDSDSETYQEGSHSRGFGKSRIIFPEIPAVEKSGFVLHLNKKRHYEERIKSSAIPATFVSDKVHLTGSKLQPLSDLNEGDGLASAISLFALALERIKSKMKSSVRNRSAQILTSAAEGIQLQLQTAESQIQADILKLSGINKLKRKRLDMRYEELQGQLNAIHERFKDEVNRHLQDCRSVVEGLDAHHMELRGTVEKQGVSHKKLLLETEETIETQLSDAQRKITEVHHLAREKMIQLKRAVADCLSGNM